MDALTTSISARMKSAQTTPVSKLDVCPVTMKITNKDTGRTIKLVISESLMQSEVTQIFSSSSFTARKCQASTVQTLDKFLTFIKTCCSTTAINTLLAKSEDGDATGTSICTALFESVSESMEHHSLAFGKNEPKPHVKDIMVSLNHRVLKHSQKGSVIDKLVPLLSSSTVLREVDDVAGKTKGHFTRGQPANRLFYHNFSDDCGSGHILYFNMDKKSLTDNRVSVDPGHSTLNLSNGSSVQLLYNKVKANLLDHATPHPNDRSVVEIGGMDFKRFSFPMSNKPYEKCLPKRSHLDVRINTDNMQMNPGPASFRRIHGEGKLRVHIPVSQKLDQVTKQRYNMVPLYC